MTTKEAIAAGKTRMEKACRGFRKGAGTLRTGRANASILDAIRVDYHGTPMPVNQLGTVTVPEADAAGDFAVGPSVVPLIDKPSGLGPGAEPHKRRQSGARAEPSPTEERRKGYREALAQSAGESPHGRCATSGGDVKETIDKLEKDKRSARTNKNGRWTRWKISHGRPRRLRICPPPKRGKSWNCGSCKV